MTMFSTKYPNNIRTVSGLNVAVYNNDVVLAVNTSSGACSINLNAIPAGYWSTQWKLYIYDASNNAAVNNITINAGSGQKINNNNSLILSTNGAGAVISVINNTSFIASLSSGGGSGITAFTVTDTSTIDLTLASIPGGFNLQANVTLNDWLVATKLTQTTNTSYCKTTSQVGLNQKYDNPFQSITDGSIFKNYDLKTENGTMVNSFDLVKGIFEAPSTGWYFIQSLFGYKLNSDPYQMVSDNPNTLGKYWMNNYTPLYRVINILNDPSTLASPPVAGDRYLVGGTATGAFTGYDNQIAEYDGAAWNFTAPATNNYLFIIATSQQIYWTGSKWETYMPSVANAGTFQVTNYLIGSGLLSNTESVRTMGTTSLYIFTNSIVKLNASDKIEVIYTNNTDLELYGQSNSALTFKCIKLSN